MAGNTESYVYTIVHRPGRVHSNADALSRRPCSEICSHCSKRENKESLRVSTVGVELNNENSTMAREKVNGERQVSDKRSENAVYAGDQSCQDVHNAIFLREKFVYKTHLAIGINSNSGRCLNEIDTRVPNSMGSVYEATSHARKRGFARETSHNVCNPEENCKGMSMGSVYEATSHAHKRGVARETSPDVCKPEENCKGMSSHHSVGAVKTRSMNNRESNIERGTHVSNDDDTCSEINHSNDELENEHRNDTTLKLILSWKENNLKPSWAEVSKYGTEVKYYWNRLNSRNKREHSL